MSQLITTVLVVTFITLGLRVGIGLLIALKENKPNTK
jgi:hypothetical protein